MIRVLLIVASLLLAAPAFAGPEMLLSALGTFPRVNVSDFETGTAVGWGLTNSFLQSNSSDVPSGGGTYSWKHFPGASQVTYMSQTVPNCATGYIDFWYKNSATNGSGIGLSVSVGGGAYIFMPVAASWTHSTADIPVSAGSNVIIFRTQEATAYLDNIRISLQ